MKQITTVRKDEQYKISDGTIFCVDDIETVDIYGKDVIMVRASMLGGEKGRYADSIEDFILFLNENNAVKIK